eukprot:SAG22_NODE_2179_length_2878_cov_1.678661_3_plen_189_part_01
MPCPAGTVDDDRVPATVCVACPAGQSSVPGQITCELCDEGTYAAAGAAVCADCAAGQAVRFKPPPPHLPRPSTWWLSCPPGPPLLLYRLNRCCRIGHQDTDRNAGTPCAACATGQFSDTGTTECTDCGAGYYSEDGAFICTPCQPGTLDLDSDPATPCVTCAPGKFSDEAATVCGCAAGYELLAGGGGC